MTAELLSSQQRALHSKWRGGFLCILLSAAAFASLKETASGVSTLCMCSCQLGSSVFIKAKNDGVRKFSLRAQNINAAKKTHSTLCLRSQVEMKLRKIVTKFGSRCGQLIKGSAREGGKEKSGIQFPFMCISKSDRSPSVFIINSGYNFSPLCWSDTHKENINKLFN